MKRSRFHILKNKWLIIGVIIVIVVIVIFWMRSSSSAPTFQSAAASIGTVVETVSVTGTVSPIDRINLAFEKSGSIAEVNVSVGDKVHKGDVIASLDDATDQAALASAQATFADMARGLTPQELAVQQSAVASAQTAYNSAGIDAINAAHDGFAKAQAALFNYADTFFTNPQSANPVINIRTQSSVEQMSINTARLAASDTMGQWSLDLASASSSQASGIISKSRGYLASIKTFMSSLSSIVNNLNPGNSGMTQAQINIYVSTINTGISTLNSAIDAVDSARAALVSQGTALTQAQSNYNLKLSGNSSQSIAAQGAKVAQAQALLKQDVIVSPIDGVVTQADPKVGEFVSAGQSGFTVQNSDFKIEAFVPEADIAKVSVGDLASSTLDAYGSDTDFPTQVTMINPAETVLEGVPTYKVTLHFVTPDPRIRSGMTTNLDIHTRTAVGVLEIPYRAVVDTGGDKSVRLVSADGKTYSSVPVGVGLKGSDGMIEIISGLNVGDKVVTYLK